MTTDTGQREARFRALFTDAYPDVLRFAQRRVHPSHAEDVTAEAFLVVWRRLDEAPIKPGDLRAWLFGIARNHLLNERRSSDRRDALAVRIAQSTTSSWGHHPDLDVVPMGVDLTTAWRRLSDSDQEVLALTVFDDLSSPQAARVLGVTAAAYRLRLMRARRALRRQVNHPAAATTRTPSTQESAS